MESNLTELKEIVCEDVKALCTNNMGFVLRVVVIESSLVWFPSVLIFVSWCACFLCRFLRGCSYKLHPLKNLQEEQANQIFKSLWPHCSRQRTPGCHPFAACTVDVTVCFNRQIVSAFTLGFSRFPKRPLRLHGICLSLKYFSSISFPASCLSVKSTTNVPFKGLLMLPLLPYPWYTSF